MTKSWDTHKGGYSFIGRKPTQQDEFYYSPNTINGDLVFVADGVGGHAGGDYASHLCKEVFSKSFEQDPMITDERAYLRDHIMEIARQVYHKGKTDDHFANCGTTLSGFLLSGGRYHLFHVGDSRVYLFDQEQSLIQLTEDHSVVAQMLQRGEISEAEAKTHPQRNTMYSAIGQVPEEIRIDIVGPYDLNKGEILLAFSDGVHDALTDDEIRNIILKYPDIHDLCKEIVVAAYDAGGKDNITAVGYRN